MAAFSIVTALVISVFCGWCCFQIGNKFSNSTAVEDTSFRATNEMLTALGLDKYQKNFKKGQLTDQCLTLLTERCEICSWFWKHLEWTTVSTYAVCTPVSYLAWAFTNTPMKARFTFVLQCILMQVFLMWLHWMSTIFKPEQQFKIFLSLISAYHIIEYISEMASSNNLIYAQGVWY